MKTHIDKSLVSIMSCASYEQNLVNKVIRESLNNLGGLEKFVKRGQKVHVKPNLLSAKIPERAATTHPAIVRALIIMLRELDCDVSIGDSPAGISKPIEQYWRLTGMQAVAEETGARLVAFEKKGIIEHRVNGQSYFIAQVVAEADIVINVCKMKTHGLTLYTGAIKNIFGTIPGVKKAEYHKIAPKVDKFSEIIVDIYEAVSPRLHIQDAVLAMEANGPSSGVPKHVGLILASEDGVALDAVAAEIMGFNQDEILTTQIASKRGLGCSDLNNIDIKGISKNKLEKIDFLLPSNRIVQLIPEFLMKLVGKFIWIRPRVDEKKCKQCGLCIQGCPVKAMSRKNGIPDINEKICIKCFCCDEICPYDAINQEMSWMAKKFI